MTTPYELTFGVRSLSGMAETFAKEEMQNSLLQGIFAKGQTLEPEGETVEWDEYQMHRHLAPFSGRDGAFPLLEDATRINRSSGMAHIKLMKRLPAAKLYSERAPGQLKADASAVIDFEIRDMVKTIRNSIEYLAANTLNGTVTINNTNVPGSQVAYTITYSPNTYTAAASWATAATKIVSVELPALKQDFLQASGLMPKTLIVGGTIQGYVAQNTEITSLLQNQYGKELAVGGVNLVGQSLDGFPLGGLDWIVDEAGYVPQGGAFTRFMPATDTGFLLPGDADLKDVLGMALGRGFVPAGSDVGPASPESAMVMAAPAPTRGFYSYAARASNPKTDIEIYVGWVGLPILKFPSGICVLDSVP